MKKTLAVVAVCAMILSLLSVAIFAVKADELGEVSEAASETISEGASEEVSEAASEEPSEAPSEEPSEEPIEEYSEEPLPDPPAETDLWIAPDRTVGAPGRDVTVNFTIKQNPGFWGISLFVTYDDSVMTLKSLTVNPDWKRTMGLVPVGLTENPFTLRCMSNDMIHNFAETGVLATAVFTVAEDARVGSWSKITIDYNPNDVINLDSDNVPLTVWEGLVRVVREDQLPPEPSEELSEEPSEEPSEQPSEEPSEEPSDESSETSDDTVVGDADGDSNVNMKDVLFVRKFIAGMDVAINMAAADVNHDGDVNMKDVLMIRKYIAGLIESLG